MYTRNQNPVSVKRYEGGFWLIKADVELLFLKSDIFEMNGKIGKSELKSPLHALPESLNL